MVNQHKLAQSMRFGGISPKCPAHLHAKGHRIGRQRSSPERSQWISWEYLQSLPCGHPWKNKTSYIHGVWMGTSCGYRGKSWENYGTSIVKWRIKLGISSKMHDFSIARSKLDPKFLWPKHPPAYNLGQIWCHCFFSGYPKILWTFHTLRWTMDHFAVYQCKPSMFIYFLHVV